MFKFSKRIKSALCVNADYDNEEFSKFYIMLLKYKKNHPNFNSEKLISKLYSRIDLNDVCKSKK